MKTRFSTIDIMAMLNDLQQYIGMRVNNVYDIDHKTYLIKLQKPDAKAMLLFESGARFHATEFEWPKQPMPSSFAMKLRKHIKQKRLEHLQQLGVDRIIDMQFGSAEVACHVIVELYDRGNVVLSDHEYRILNVLRPRTDKDNADVKFVVRELYPLHMVRPLEPLMPFESFCGLLGAAKFEVGDSLRKILNPHFVFGPALIDHCLTVQGFQLNAQIGKHVHLDQADDVQRIYTALVHAQELFEQFHTGTHVSKGIITVKYERRANPHEANVDDMLETYEEFHPMLFTQHDRVGAYKQFDTFCRAVDDFFSKVESQNLDKKALQAEKQALKKLENVRKDHEERLGKLKDQQDVDERRAELIELNREMIDRAILVIRGALANQLSWPEVQTLVDEAKLRGDPVASAIKQLKLEINHISMLLSEPFHADDDTRKPQVVDIDLSLGAYANARKYYDHKKQAAQKEQKTVDASAQALRSAEQKTMEALKNVQIKKAVTKNRKAYWFEKFQWFVSSENYLVIGGRDQQQNELIVKRYLRPGDVYVHADIRGAASVVVKNALHGGEVPPKTLNEAGTMAMCCSAAWDAKVVTNVWWVSSEQVSKTAPTGEYLTTGSFMIRGKKNFLPSCQLVMGFGFLFRLDEESVHKHAGERSRVTLSVDEQELSQADENSELNVVLSGSGSSEEDSEPETDAFPDVQVPLRHLSVDTEEATLVETGHTPRIKVGKKPTKQLRESAKPLSNVTVSTRTSADDDNKTITKRGQRHKLKKIKEKYADQDDEERKLKLQLIGATGPQRETKKAQKLKAQQQRKLVSTNVAAAKKAGPAAAVVAVQPEPTVSGDEEDNEPPPVAVAANDVTKPLDDDDDAGDDDVDDLGNEEADDLTSTLNCLTGKPEEDDVLLFAMPVCAPYGAMQGYKYKVKLTPGAGKKGKACKAAMQMFLKDRFARSLEKDLLKAVLDTDLARNLPGKVKVSAPQLTASKQKYTVRV